MPIDTEFTSRELLARLVAFETVSHDSNLSLIDWVSHYLAGYGIGAHVTTNDERTKANLFATVGPAGMGGICLHAHTDVVPVEGQAWDTHPFALTEIAGLLHGRGSCDMKGFAACMLAAVPMLCAVRLKTPVHLAFSYDEEVGCLGAPRMLQAFGGEVVKPGVAIVGEPTMMQPVIAHKGVLALTTEFHGQPAHSSMPHLGVSAIAAAGEMIAELTQCGHELQRMHYPYAMKPSGPTINVGTVSGGKARNIVAENASLLWEIRFRDLDDAQELLALAENRVGQRLRRIFGANGGGIRWQTTQVAHIPPFCAPESSRAVALAREFGAVGAATAVPYGAEAGQYAHAGVDTVICGPGSIEQAHGANEFVSIVQMEACDRFMGRLARWARDNVLAEPAAA